MAVGIKVKTNLVRLRHRVSPAAFMAGRRALANQIGADANRFIPKKSGALRTTQVIAVDASFVSWVSPYAHRQFTAPAGWKYSTPGTGPHWTDIAKAQYIDSWKKALVKGMGM